LLCKLLALQEEEEEEEEVSLFLFFKTKVFLKKRLESIEEGKYK